MIKSSSKIKCAHEHLSGGTCSIVLDHPGTDRVHSFSSFSHSFIAPFVQPGGNFAPHALHLERGR